MDLVTLGRAEQRSDACALRLFEMYVQASVYVAVADQ